MQRVCRRDGVILAPTGAPVLASDTLMSLTDNTAP